MTWWLKLLSLILPPIAEWVCTLCGQHARARKAPTHCGRPMKPSGGGAAAVQPPHA